MGKIMVTVMGFANMYLQAYYLYCYVLLTERFLEYPIPNYEFSKQSCLFSSKNLVVKFIKIQNSGLGIRETM